MTREEIINMSDEEARAWIYEFPVDSPEFVRRHNTVWFDCGLSRMGICLEPTRSGELELDSE